MADLSWDTPTMAELFLKQGHPRRALAVYRKVLAQNPNDTSAQGRIAAILAQLEARQGEPMNFREHMQRIVQATPGAVACMVMGFDGIAIDSYEAGAGEVDIPTLLIEYSAATQQLRRAAQDGGAAGHLLEMQVTGSKLSALIRPLNDEYFIAVVLHPGGLTGKARFLMRTISSAIAKELS